MAGVFWSYWPDSNRRPADYEYILKHFLYSVKLIYKADSQIIERLKKVKDEEKKTAILTLKFYIIVACMRFFSFSGISLMSL